MNTIRKLFSIICIIASFVPVYGQKDTITGDGLYLKYNTPYYNDRNGIWLDLAMKKLKNKNIILPTPNDSDMVRGELDRATKCIGLIYKALPQYIISETFGLSSSEENSRELLWTAGTTITSQWIHEDGGCILFIKCNGGIPNKSYDKLPEIYFNWIKVSLGLGYLLEETTEEQMQKIKKEITIWSPEKAKETFNAQYVITYPIKNKKSVYMGKYTHKLDLMMIKWGGNLTVSFLVTRKGKRNIDKYIKEVEEAFWFED